MLVKKDIQLHYTENGSIILIVMIMLLLLSIIGIAVNDLSNVEIQLAGNDRIYKQNFFLSESATVIGETQLEDLTPTERSDSNFINYTWLHKYDYTQPIANRINMTHISYWNGGNSANISPTNPQGKFSVVDMGISPDTSQSMTNPESLHLFHIYGLGQSTNGNVIIETLYKATVRND
ncbi:MAG: hypothetical protein HQK77_13620 [Desulfobacterales bacterium]|nr:hypothetical protein [Desulfobacterales bacterium]